MDSGCDLGDSGPDFDCDGLGLSGVDSDGVSSFDVSSYSFDGGDVDSSASEVLAESAGDLSSADYSVTDCEDGNAIFGRFVVRSDQPRTFAVHVIGHGFVDLQGFLDDFARLDGLVRIPATRVSGRGINKEHDEILPLSTWSTEVASGKKSAGWYHGATGTTSVWRRYYCVGKRSNFWNPLSGLVYDREASAFIEVTGISWRYHETGDCETRVMVKVSTIMRHDRESMRYIVLEKPLAQNNRLAEVLKTRIFRTLRQANPGKAVAQKRALKQLGFAGAGGGVEDGVVQAERPIERGRVLIPA